MKIKKILLLMFVFIILVIPLASAYDFAFNNVMEFEDTGDYGKYSYYDHYLITRSKFADVELIENTDQCMADCYAIIKVDLYTSYDNLVKDLKTFSKEGKEKKIKKKEVLIKVGERIGLQNTFKNVCVLGEDGINKCHDEITGTKEVTENIWEVYERKELEAGSYYFKILGEKQAAETIDWQINLFSTGLTKEWAWWIGVTPTAYYKMNNNDDDETGTCNDMSPINSPSFTASGKLNYAGDTTGGDSMYWKTDTACGEVAFGTNNFTVAMWFKTNGENVIVNNYGDDNWGQVDSWAFLCYGTYNDGLMLNVNVASIETADLNCSDNAWHRGVVVREGTGANEVKLYLDGVNVINGTMATNINNEDKLVIEYGAPGSTFGTTSDALIDDIQIFNNFAWSVADVITDYNVGNGIEAEDIAVPTVTLVSPPNNTKTNIVTQTFQCNATDDGTIINITLHLNGELNYTQAGSGTSNLTLLTDVVLAEGDYNWTCGAYNNVDQFDTTANFSLQIDLTMPTIEALFNITNITTTTLPTPSTWNYTAADINLDACYYNSSDNATYTPITCNSTITTSWASSGYKIIQYCANDTIGNENCQLTNLSIFHYGITQAVDKTTIGEGDTATFNLTIDFMDIETNYPDTYAILTHNTTNYTATTTFLNSSRAFFSQAINIDNKTGDVLGGNVSWYWNYDVLSGSTSAANLTTAIQTQRVYKLAIDNCTTYGEVIFNITIRDEESHSQLNASAGHTNIEVEVDITSRINPLLTWEYSNQFINDSHVQICIPKEILNNSQYDIQATLGYDEVDRVREFFYLDKGTLNSSYSYDAWTTKDLNLLDLLAADSTTFLFEFTNEDDLDVPNAVVHTFRKYIGEGIFREVERSKQDDNGETHIHLVEEDVIYYFVITLEGEEIFTTATYNARCQEVPCVITISARGGVANFTTDWDLIDDTTIGTYTFTTNSTLRRARVVYNLLASSTMNLTVWEYSNNPSEINATGSDVETAASGTLTVTVPASDGNKTYYATLYKDGKYITTQWLYLEGSGTDYFGATLGVFMAALLVLALGLMTASEGVPLVIFLIVGLIAATILHLVDLSWIGLIYIAVAGGIIIWKITERRRT